ncbi:MAG: histone deacetylase [Tepidisphaeraceae bacterium]
MTAAFVSSPRFVEHDTGPGHPERADRIRAVHRAVREAGLIDSPDPFPDFELNLGITKQSEIKYAELVPTPATEANILRVHPQRMIDHVKRFSAAGAVLDQGDTTTCPASFEIALLSAGSAITAVDAVVKGCYQRAFSAARPPGHHAEYQRPMGFCLFNNIAIAARHAQFTYDIERIAIVDFDVHHGNGTQDVFEDDGTVLFISLHQHPDTLYPNSGYAHEVGNDAGRGTTVNLPMNPGSGDDEYADVFDRGVLPALDRFKPQLLLVSAGFDAHIDDPLAAINLTDDGYEMMTRTLVQAANQYAGGKIVSVLEGGYNLRALGRGVVRHMRALAR